MALLAAAEHDRHLHLVLLLEEALDVAALGLVVVLGDLRASSSPARYLLLVLAGGLRLLLLVVLVLRVIENAADRRIRLRGDLDQVEIALAGSLEASAVGTIPICSPFSSIRRTSGTRIRSLIRV